MIPVHGYDDPRMAHLYETFNGFAADTAYYIGLAGEVPGCAVVDIGCGTGLLGVELANRGHRVTGVDPAGAMLDIARSRPGGEQPNWIHGDATALGADIADLAVMTGNVAQVFVTDDAWHDTLRAAHRALRPGGRIAFESRNPDDQAWKTWNPTDSYSTLDHPDYGHLDSWHEVVDVTDGVVTYVSHTRFDDTGEHLIAEDVLRFRSRSEITEDLRANGFTVQHVFADWERMPFNSSARVMAFVAVRD